MADIAAKIAEIRALATEEAINDAVNKKVDAMRKIGDQEDNEIEGPCPFVDRFPVELRVKVYTALLRYKNPVRVIPRRKRFSSPNDLEAERLSCTRLNIGILFANRLIHREALEVFYRLNQIRCSGTELARMRLQPQIVTHLTRVEVSFESLNQLTAIQEHVDWTSTVNAHALLRLASDAPRLHTILVRLDNLFLLPPLHDAHAPGIQANPVTFSSFLEEHGLCEARKAQCFAMGRWRICGYPRLEFRHFRVVEFWPKLLDYRKRGGPIFQDYGVWTKDESIAHELMETLGKNSGCRCVGDLWMSQAHARVNDPEPHAGNISRKVNGRGIHGQDGRSQMHGYRHDMFECGTATEHCSFDCRTGELAQQVAVIEEAMRRTWDDPHSL